MLPRLIIDPLVILKAVALFALLVAIVAPIYFAIKFKLQKKQKHTGGE